MAENTSDLKVEIAVVKNTVEALAKSVDKLETATSVRNENLTRAIENLQSATGAQYERLVAQIAAASAKSSADLAHAIDRTTANILAQAKETTLRQEATMKDQMLRYEASLKEQVEKNVVTTSKLDLLFQWKWQIVGGLLIVAALWKSGALKKLLE